jgi:hypothetical protein
MAQYLSQMRRGVKDDATGRNDWAEYEKLPDHIKPLEGELVLEYDNGIPRLKIGNGKDEFSALPYMSVDSFILPKTASVYLNPNAWELMTDDDGDRYCQVVRVQNAIITPNSKVDLTPSSAQLDEFRSLGLVFVAENEDGVIRVCCLGNVPTNGYTVPVTVTEVIVYV